MTQNLNNNLKLEAAHEFSAVDLEFPYYEIHLHLHVKSVYMIQS